MLATECGIAAISHDAIIAANLRLASSNVWGTSAANAALRYVVIGICVSVLNLWTKQRNHCNCCSHYQRQNNTQFGYFRGVVLSDEPLAQIQDHFHFENSPQRKVGGQVDKLTGPIEYSKAIPCICRVADYT
jgi:hypothetical protein